MAASKNGQLEVVNMLLQHGARVDLQNKVYTCFFCKLSHLLSSHFFKFIFKVYNYVPHLCMCT